LQQKHKTRTEINLLWNTKKLQPRPRPTSTAQVQLDSSQQLASLHLPFVKQQDKPNYNYSLINMCPSSSVSSQATAAGCKKRTAAAMEFDVLPTHNRKRVRFQEGNNTTQCIALCADISPQENSARWIQPEEKDEIRRSAGTEAKECRMQDTKFRSRGQSHLAFSELYTAVYTACHLDEMGEAADIIKLMPADMLVLMAQSQSRGLEDHKVPHMAIQRRVCRKQAIRLVMRVQSSSSVNDPERLRETAEALSMASRRFAQVLGTADAISAMMEYSTEAEATPTAVKHQDNNETREVTTRRDPKLTFTAAA
jgi:hypothetical protein